MNSRVCKARYKKGRKGLHDCRILSHFEALVAGVRSTIVSSRTESFAISQYPLEDLAL
jgi:hypothetical protein